MRSLLPTVALMVIVFCRDPLPTQAGDSGSSKAVEEYRHFALVNEGDEEDGKVLFETNRQLSCRACHRITGKERSGPNLDGIGDKFTREELIHHILEPSATIKPGFEQAIYLLDNGKLVQGRVERATKTEVRLLDAEGKTVRLSPERIERMRVSEQSMMPDDSVATISKQQFADLISYLASLQFGVKQGLNHWGEAVPIPRLQRPVRFAPIHSAELAFDNPVWCGPIPGLQGQLAVLEHQEGKIWRYVRDAKPPRKELFADLGELIHISANQGLMGLAFHPDYEKNRRYFLEYEVKEQGVVKTTIVERQASSDLLCDSAKPSRRLLEVEQPAFNHNGGCIAFGPDGMLYAGFGDGGPQKDPPGFSQNPSVLLGSMIRIDVDRRTGDLPFGIPLDNPFVSPTQRSVAARPETYAYGFREPWRFSFDALTGELYVGDVGQNAFEEVCLVGPGENHGWNVVEAFEPFSDEYRRESEDYQPPLFAYPHGLGFSVTGGHVYRAEPESSFDGVYIFGDYNTRRVWGLRQNEGKLIDVHELGTAPGGIASFGVDHDGEILLVAYDGTIYHVDVSETDYHRVR